jgi:hypothetical protein
MTEPQCIIWYDQLTHQWLGTDDADIGTYAEFCAAFDILANACRAQAFEKVYADIPRMLLWLRDNGHKNDNAGRAAYSTTLQAIHPDVDYVPKQQTYAAANFGGIFGPMGLGVDQRGRHYTPTVDFEAMPRMNRWR